MTELVRALEAKYKFDEIEQELKEIETGESDGGEDETPQQRTARDVKRVDVLKMHAYRDAIRRTGGAYVLYPGNAAKAPRRLYDEILPGLGAFPLSPSIDSSSEIETFLADVATHLSDRMTKWEEYTFQRHAVYDAASRVTMIQADAYPGFYRAIKGAGVFPLPVSHHLASPASVRWIAVPDDDPSMPPHVLRVAVHGYRGTMNLAVLTRLYASFIPVALGDRPDIVFHVWRIDG